jgi:hypothetical protein
LNCCRNAVNKTLIEKTFNETFNDFFNNRVESVLVAG